MNYNAIITRLYYLLIYADGDANEKELALARQMTKSEGMKEADFAAQLTLLKSRSNDSLYNETISALKKLDRVRQVRAVAWLCVLANADGFMERSEWQLIYKIYHKELSLPLNEIFDVQKQLNKMLWEKNYT
ncbi:MAG TPA: TerB family tellurite resistance protein [Chryseosolibacter sp.]|nr:TerB family tellurite resistance protein [Chryseosolibacter sp.]